MSRSVAIVTGSSSGIGRATAIRLSRDFSAVVLAARGSVEFDEVAEEVRASGAEPLAINLDLMASTAAEAVVSQTLAKFGRIDALLNVAGAVPGIDLFQMTRRAVEYGYRAQASRGTTADAPRVAGFESGERCCGPHRRQYRGGADSFGCGGRRS
jgi:NAD(P)-dependent dehydrogenase (short-subunit alcohol dehydrogenase family)